MKKVLMIGIDRNIADPSHEVYRRLQSYRSRFDLIDVIVLNKKVVPEHEGDGGIIRSAHSFFKMPRMLKAASIAFGLKKLRGKYDWITTSDASELGLLGFLLANLLGCKLQVQIHTDIFAPEYLAASVRHHIQAAMAVFIIKQATHVRVVSEKIRRDCLKRGVEEKRVSVVPVAVDVERIKKVHPVQNLSKGYDWTALFVGRLEKEKNPVRALRWFSQMRGLCGNGCLIVIGSGNLLEKMRKQVKKMGLESVVFFKGALPYEETIAHMKSASVLLCTSRYEGYGMVLAEAGVCGLPIISRDVGIAKELGARMEDGDKISEHVAFGAWPKPFVPAYLVYSKQELYVDAWTKPFFEL